MRKSILFFVLFVSPLFIEQSSATTPCATATPTKKPTVTSTCTIRPTSSPTPSKTPTQLPSSTSTPTKTSTATATRTQTSTPTSMATATRTATPSFTPTVIATFSPTNTATAVPTSTSTPIATSTIRTATPSFTPTVFVTYSPTSTPTIAPTQTPSSTSTSTPVATSTSTPMPSPTIIIDDVACDVFSTTDVSSCINGVAVIDVTALTASSSQIQWSGSCAPQVDNSNELTAHFSYPDLGATDIAKCDVLLQVVNTNMKVDCHKEFTVKGCDPECSSIDIRNMQFVLDGLGRLQVVLVKRALALAVKARGPKKSDKKLLEEATSIAAKNWEITWSLPSDIVSCSALNCQTVSLVSSKGSYLENAQKLRDLALKVLASVKSSSAQIKRSKASQVRTVEATLKRAVSEVAGVPEESVDCSK